MATHLVPASAAASRLGVKRATLYAYVSRGLVTAHALPGRRGSWFDPVELDALARRARVPADRRPDLRITSAVTLIEAGSYWYRGRPPEEMARTRSFEGVAEWLWTGQDAGEPSSWPADEGAAARARMALAAVPKTAPATDRLRVIVSVIGAGDPLRSDLRPAGAVATARRLMGTTIAALTTLRRGSVAGRVSAWLGPRRPRPDTVRTVERTLVMMADHELAASTLAVRVAASFGADPYAAALAGLGVMSGAWHGGASGRVERLLDDVAQGQSAKSAIGALLQHEGAIPGFGQRLYPAGDPRVAVLWPLARSFGPTVEADALITVARSQGLPPPNVDFALATLVRALGLAPGAGEALFTIGRLAGWMAHAIEEYTERSEFRMRAIYTGPRPG